MAPGKITDLSSYRDSLGWAQRRRLLINPTRARWIRSQARELSVKTWTHVREKQKGKLKLVNMLPFAPRVTITEVLEWSFNEPREIGHIEVVGGAEREIAGILERKSRTITVASKFSSQIRRFTAAHELGHLVLHRAIQSFRESPITDERLQQQRRTPIEREADLFGAEYLMPSRLVQDLYRRSFGDVLESSSIDEGISFYFAGGHSISDLRAMDLLDLAKIVAQTPPITTADSRPLTEIFGVSAFAMAMQLLDLALVVRHRT